MRKILVVEDQKILREILVQSLNEEGFSVFAAPNGEMGLTLALEEKPDIIALDVILPGLSGLEVLRRIRKDPAMEKTPVLLMTNLEDPEVTKTAEEENARVLVKGDYGFADVVEKIKEVLENSKQ